MAALADMSAGDASVLDSSALDNSQDDSISKSRRQERCRRAVKNLARKMALSKTRQKTMNSFLNSSVTKRTLKTNNRDLAASLQTKRAELQQAQQVIIQLRKEHQELRAMYACDNTNRVKSDELKSLLTSSISDLMKALTSMNEAHDLCCPSSDELGDDEPVQSEVKTVRQSVGPPPTKRPPPPTDMSLIMEQSGVEDLDLPYCDGPQRVSRERKSGRSKRSDRRSAMIYRLSENPGQLEPCSDAQPLSREPSPTHGENLEETFTADQWQQMETEAAAVTAAMYEPQPVAAPSIPAVPIDVLTMDDMSENYARKDKKCENEGMKKSAGRRGTFVVQEKAVVNDAQSPQSKPRSRRQSQKEGNSEEGVKSPEVAKKPVRRGTYDVVPPADDSPEKQPPEAQNTIEDLSKTSREVVDMELTNLTLMKDTDVSPPGSPVKDVLVGKDAGIKSGKRSRSPDKVQPTKGRQRKISEKSLEPVAVVSRPRRSTATGAAKKYQDKWSETDESEEDEGQKKNFTTYMGKPGQMTFSTGQANPPVRSRSKSRSTLPKPPRSRSKQSKLPQKKVEGPPAPKSVYDLSMNESALNDSVEPKKASTETSESKKVSLKERISLLNQPRPVVPQEEVITESPHGIMLLLGDGKRTKARSKQKSVRYVPPNVPPTEIPPPPEHDDPPSNPPPDDGPSPTRSSDPPPSDVLSSPTCPSDDLPMACDPSQPDDLADFELPRKRHLSTDDRTLPKKARSENRPSGEAKKQKGGKTAEKKSSSQNGDELKPSRRQRTSVEKKTKHDAPNVTVEMRTDWDKPPDIEKSKDDRTDTVSIHVPEDKQVSKKAPTVTEKKMKSSDKDPTSIKEGSKVIKIETVEKEGSTNGKKQTVSAEGMKNSKKALVAEESTKVAEKCHTSAEEKTRVDKHAAVMVEKETDKIEELKVHKKKTEEKTKESSKKSEGNPKKRDGNSRKAEAREETKLDVDSKVTEKDQEKTKEVVTKQKGSKKARLKCSAQNGQSKMSKQKATLSNPKVQGFFTTDDSIFSPEVSFFGTSKNQTSEPPRKPEPQIKSEQKIKTEPTETLSQNISPKTKLSLKKSPVKNHTEVPLVTPRGSLGDKENEAEENKTSDTTVETESRSRRRGKIVNYTEPSLTKKMRRDPGVKGLSSK